MFNTTFIVEERKKQIINELMEINETIRELNEQVSRLTNSKKFREMEYEMLDRTVDKGVVIGGTNNNATSRLLLEDAIKSIFNNAERDAIKLADIILQLESYGYRWSNYFTAYQKITGLDSLCNTSKKGYYQFIHQRI